MTRPPLVGSCCLKGNVPGQVPNSACTSGIKNPSPGVPTVRVRAGTCSEALAGNIASGPVAIFPMLAGDDTVSLRILPDRSLADFFVQGGRASGNQKKKEKKKKKEREKFVCVFIFLLFFFF